MVTTDEALGKFANEFLLLDLGLCCFTFVGTSKEFECVLLLVLVVDAREELFRGSVEGNFLDLELVVLEPCMEFRFRVSLFASRY